MSSSSSTPQSSQTSRSHSPSLHKATSRKREREEEEMLGIFAEQQDNFISRGGIGAAKNTYAAGIGFVKQRALNEGDDEEEEDDEQEEEEEEEEEDEFMTQERDEDTQIAVEEKQERGFIPKSFRSSRTHRADLTFKPETEAQPSRNMKTAAKAYQRNHKRGNDPQVADWDVKGIATSLMAKMGWSKGQGLGKDKSGIVQPLDHQLRQKGAGLGFDGQDKVSKSNKSRTEATSGKDASKDASKDAPRRQAWRRDAPPKKKIRYPTVAEILKNEELPESSTPSRIVDMTGKTTRILDNMLGVRQSSANSLLDDNQYLLELKKNVGILSSDADQKMHRDSKDLQLLIMEIKSGEARAAQLQEQANVRAAKMQRIREISTLFSDCKQMNPIDMRDALGCFHQPFKSFRENYAAEYRELDLVTGMIALLAPIVKKEMSLWEPLIDPHFQLDIFDAWRNVLQAPQTQVSDNREMTAYEALIWHSWLPPVRSALNNQWEVSDFESAVNLLDLWKPHIPEFIVDHLIDQVIIPKLRAAVELWDPRRGNQTLHSWLYPWLSLMGSHIDSLVLTLRSKISIALQNWIPSDHSAHSLVKSWESLFRPEDISAITDRVILPKLRYTMKMEFVIDPSQQQIHPLNNLLLWRDLIAEKTLSEILEQDFFRPWLRVLQQWLSQDTQHGTVLQEVSEWYRVSKSWFPSEVNEWPVVRRGFTVALEMMNTVTSNNRDSLSKFDKYWNTVGSSKADSGIRKVAPTQEVQVTFKGTLEHLAAENNVIFKLTQRRHPGSGKPIFLFGKTALYMDRDIAWVPGASLADKWRPISFDEIVALQR